MGRVDAARVGDAREVPADGRSSADIILSMAMQTIRVPGCEADDVMAILARQAAEKGERLLLVTNDHDMLGCLNDYVDLYIPHRKLLVTKESFIDSYGIDPSLYGAVQAMAGCPGDGIVGIKGVGERTATKWLQKHGSLESVIENVPRVSEHRDLVMNNMNLLTGSGHEEMKLELSRGMIAPDTLAASIDTWEFRVSERSLNGGDGYERRRNHDEKV